MEDDLLAVRPRLGLDAVITLVWPDHKPRWAPAFCTAIVMSRSIKRGSSISPDRAWDALTMAATSNC